MTFPSICVIIPTFRRPEGLDLAMGSIAAQYDVEADITLVVSDNSPDAGACYQVMNFAKTAPFEVLYIHEPKTGVASARNAGLAAKESDFIAFLDDDEVAPREWLRRLLATQALLDADVIFGPVRARLPEGQFTYADYLTDFFSRFGPDETGLIPYYYGCGNSFIRRSVLIGGQVFDTSRNNSGGEDDMLFSTLLAKGVKLGWDADAFVFEDVPLKRANLNYALKRAFAYGQGPSVTAAMSKQPLHCLGWMIQGLVQSVIFGAGGLLAYVTRSQKAASYWDKAARGLGKLLWFPPFKTEFYGTVLLEQ